MSSIVQRVRKLVALSGSPNENEARTAAFVACRLIREHGLHIGDSASGTRHVEVAPEPPKRRVTRGPYSRARNMTRQPRCQECSEPIASDDACVDADGLSVHGDCIPKGERP